MDHKEIILSFDNPSDAARAGIDMQKADPSLRYIQTKATIIVTWHANIIVAAQAVEDRGIPFTMLTLDEIKNAHRR